MKNTKNTTPPEQFIKPNRNMGETETNSILLKHIHESARSWLFTCTSIMNGWVLPWDQTSPLSENSLKISKDGQYNDQNKKDN